MNNFRNIKTTKTAGMSAIAALLAGLVCLYGQVFAQDLSDRQGRPNGEKRVEQNRSRGAEGAAQKGSKQAAVQDVQNKAQRGTATVMRGERRTFSGPTDRLSRAVRERAHRVVMAPAKSAAGGRGRK